MKEALKIAVIGFGIAVSTQAYSLSWYESRIGLVVSDTCVDSYGNWFRFHNRSGVVGSSCWWVVNGLRHQGVFA